jgi:hypothetical protein
MVLCFIISNDPVDEAWSVSGHRSTAWGPSYRKLWHVIGISQNCLNWTKAYIHFPSKASQVSPSVAHEQILHSFGSFIIDGLFWPPRPPIISNALPASLKFNSLFCHSAIGRGLLPKCIYEVVMDFLGAHPFFTEVFHDVSDFNFLDLV